MSLSSSIVLKPFVGVRPVKSCLKVLTLEDSLSTIELQEEKEHKERSFRKGVSRIFENLTKSNGPTTDIGDKVSPDTELQATKAEDLSYSIDELLTAFDKSESTLETVLIDDSYSLTQSQDRPSKVRFNEVLIREYASMVDINPGVSRGPAMGLSWEYAEIKAITVDDWELCHPPRREMREMKMTMNERMDVLRASGHSRNEILQMIKATNIARNQRKATLERMKLAGTQAKVERLGRAAMRFIGLRGTTADELDDLWEHAQL